VAQAVIGLVKHIAPPLPTVSWTQADIDNYMKEELKKEQP